jgi:HEAT repeat protein
MGTLTAVLAQGDDVQAYIKALKSADVDVRRQAAVALEKLGPDAKSAVPALQAALRDPDQFVRRFAARALGAIGPAAAPAVNDLVQMLRAENREEAEAAVSALAKIGKPAVQPLAKFLESSNDPQMVIQVAKALGGMGPDAAAAVPALIEKLKNPPKVPAILAAIVEALGNIGPAARDAVPVIKDLMADKLLAKNKEFRAVATTAIKKISK